MYIYIFFFQKDACMYLKDKVAEKKEDMEREKSPSILKMATGARLQERHSGVPCGW